MCVYICVFSMQFSEELLAKIFREQNPSRGPSEGHSKKERSLECVVSRAVLRTLVMRALGRRLLGNPLRTYLLDVGKLVHEQRMHTVKQLHRFFCYLTAGNTSYFSRMPIIFLFVF